MRGIEGTGARVALVVSRFPKLSETFVLYELEALVELGVAVELFPLLRHHETVRHPESEEWLQRARFTPHFSASVLRANLETLLRSPLRYTGAFAEIVWGTRGSLGMLIRAVAVFPKAVAIARQAARLEVRHVHAHFATHATVVALVVYRLTGIPFSFTAHGSDLHVDRQMLAAKVDACKFAVTISGYNRQVFMDECGNGVADKVHVVHCGVDTDVFQPGPDRPRGRPFEFVSVASLLPVKGHRFLIEACGVLKERDVDFRCHLVGDGPLREGLENQAAAAGLSESIIFHGSLARPEVSAILPRVDAAILASAPTPEGHREGIPVALMEAMACGLPVVASDLSGIPELVEDRRNGILTAPTDANDIADALELLANDPDLRKQMGTAARETILSEFHLRTNSATLAKLMLGEDRPTD